MLESILWSTIHIKYDEKYNSLGRLEEIKFDAMEDQSWNKKIFFCIISDRYSIDCLPWEKSRTGFSKLLHRLFRNKVKLKLNITIIIYAGVL